MSEKRFLTVMAVFDQQTQERLGEIQRFFIENISSGSQTMGIPFHLTLGSYPTDELDSVTEKIKAVAEKAKPFDIKLLRYGHFGDKVLFLEPEITGELTDLRKCFECDYANGFEWVPHATLFCGNPCEVTKAVAAAPMIDFPIYAKIVGIELGEFFPPQKKFSITFR